MPGEGTKVHENREPDWGDVGPPRRGGLLRAPAERAHFGHCSQPVFKAEEGTEASDQANEKWNHRLTYRAQGFLMMLALTA